MNADRQEVKNFTNFKIMNNIEFNDFYKVPNIKFDISKLRIDLEKILKKRNLIH